MSITKISIKRLVLGWELFRNCILVALTLVFLNSCAEKSPDEEIAEYIDTVAKHVENKSTGGLRKLIADDYLDDSGFSKSEILRIAAGYFLRKQSIHVLYKTEDIIINEEDKSAIIAIYAAISDTELQKDELRLLQAEFHKLVVRLKKDSDWICTAIDWKVSNSDEFSSVAD